jgi:signal transduction histidine kinase
MKPIDSQLFDSLSTAVVVLRAAGLSVVKLNGSARALFGIGDESSYFSVQMLFPPAKKRAGNTCLGPEHLRSEGFYPGVCLRTIQGASAYVDLAVKLISDSEEGPCVALMMSNVTPHLKLQRELSLRREEIARSYGEILKQNKELTALDHAKDRFLALASHELRTPLSALIATAEVLKEADSLPREEERELVDVVFGQGQHLLMIVNDILTFSKLTSSPA